MKNCIALENQNAHRVSIIGYAAAMALAFAAALPQPAHADRVTPPPVPANIEPPAGSMAFLKGHALGTQNYVCLPAVTGFAWTFFAPQATLFNGHRKQIITHFLSPNPLESDTPRAAWQDSQDTSAVWALASPDTTSSDPAFVAPGAIPWLLLQRVGSQKGPSGGRKLTATTYIQRLNTSGGIAPATGCTQPTDLGKKALVPYTADYFFYKAQHSRR